VPSPYPYGLRMKAYLFDWTALAGARVEARALAKTVWPMERKQITLYAGT